jgi:hypothetical protein
MLEDKLNSAANHFIQLENKFFYLKYGSNRDPGKSSMLSLKNVMAVSLINTHFCFGSDKLIDILHSYVQASQTSLKQESIGRIVVSVCSGRCETEIQAKPQDLCLCMDKDKRSLFAAAFSHKYLQKKKSYLLFQHFDMGNGLQDFLSRLALKATVPIVVLFQHPSPSPDARSVNDISLAVRDCILLLLSGHIKSVHVVFDCHKSKNCWTEPSLKEVCLSKCQSHLRKLVSFSECSCISQLDEALVNHPVFGVIHRGRWAKMKVGEERCFSITSKITI